MAEKKLEADAPETDPFDAFDEEEEEEEANGAKATKKRSPLLIQSGKAMEELDVMASLPTVKQGDAERAIVLLQQIVAGRISPQASAMVRKAVRLSIDDAFRIAHAEWTHGNR